MAINIPAHDPLTTIKGKELAEVSNFKYLGSYMQSTEANLKARKAVAWKALNSMSTVWKSHISYPDRSQLTLERESRPSDSVPTASVC